MTPTRARQGPFASWPTPRKGRDRRHEVIRIWVLIGVTLVVAVLAVVLLISLL